MSVKNALRAGMLFAFAASLLAGQPQQTASIDGTVSAADGGPIPMARVYLTRQSAGGNGAYATTTDAGGRFVLKDIVPGQYRLIAKQTGFLEAPYGAKHPNRPGAPLDISVGQTLHNLNIRMTPGAVVSGRVLDRDNKPIPNAAVHLLQPRYSPQGFPTRSFLSAAETNDLGEYRIFWIAPGSYYVAATVSHPTMMLDPQEHYPGLVINEQFEGNEDVFLPAFYPNSFDLAHATLVQADPGVEVRGIDFTMMPVPVVRMQGEVVDAASGAGVPGVDVSLNQLQTDWANMAYSASAVSNSKGEFDIRRVPAGAYRLYAGFSRPNNQSKMMSSESEVQVGGRDITDLRVLLRPRDISGIRGHLTFEMGVPAQRISLRFDETHGKGSLGTVGVQLDGTFETAISPGVFNVTLALTSPGYFIRSALSGSRDVLRDGIDTSEGSTEPVEIKIGYSSAALQGTVTDDHDNSAVDATVVLIPDSGRVRLDLFRNISTDQLGRYNFRGVTPGGYKLLAFDDLEPFSYFDPAFLQKYLSRGVPVQVGESGSVAADLKLIPN